MTAVHSQLDPAGAIRQRRRLDAPPRIDRVAGLRAAAAVHGGNAWIKQLWRATRRPGRLTTDEFFYYRLYDPAQSSDDVVRFVGKAAQQRLHDACNDPHWFAVADDKALFYTVAKGAGLPIPETVAIYDPQGRSGFPMTLRSDKELQDFLVANGEWPLFAKPVDGMYSVGAMHMLGRTPAGIQMKDGTVEPAAAVMAFIKGVSQAGYLFQKVLEPHEGLSAQFGPTVASVRLLVLWDDGEPIIESAVVKIPARGSVADNYWRKGNMLGAIDVDCGEIRRVITGFGPDLTEVETHPDTGAALKGLRVPRWQAVVDACLAGARLSPHVRTQSWDVALTSAGPVLLEFNFGGDLNLHQLAHQRGALTPRFVEHLRRCGYKGKLP